LKYESEYLNIKDYSLKLTISYSGLLDQLNTEFFEFNDQLVSIHSRKVFPSFDEPTIKQEFQKLSNILVNFQNCFKKHFCFSKVAINL
jgi:hypothetical protein